MAFLSLSYIIFSNLCLHDNILLFTFTKLCDFFVIYIFLGFKSS